MVAQPAGTGLSTALHNEALSAGWGVASQSADAAEFVHAAGIAPGMQATAEQIQSADAQIAVHVRRLADVG